MPELITPQGEHSISAILFDKDGTLLQFVSLWEAGASVSWDSSPGSWNNAASNSRFSIWPPCWEPFTMLRVELQTMTGMVPWPWGR